jgi:hypothetical protein
MNQSSLFPPQEMVHPEEMEMLRSMARALHNATKEDKAKGSFTAARLAERWWATFGKDQE